MLTKISHHNTLAMSDILRQIEYDRQSMIDVVNGKENAMAEISSDVIRGYNDTIILYLLKDAPSYGYEIQKQIREISEEKYIIKETTLYSAFTRLEKAGFVQSFIDDSSGKKRTYYQITESGAMHYKAKCEEWDLTKDVIEHFIEREE